MDLIRPASACSFGASDNVVDRQDANETSILIHDRKTPNLLFGHRDERCSDLIASLAHEWVSAHHLTDPDVSGKAVRSCQSHTDVAIGDHSGGPSISVENGKRSAIVVPHAARGLDQRIARSAGSGRRRHDVLYLHQKTPPGRDHRMLWRAMPEQDGS